MSGVKSRLKAVVHALHGRGWLEVRTLLTLFIILGSLFLFVEIAGEVTGGDTADFDHAVIEWLRPYEDPSQPRGPVWLKEVARDITALGSTAVLTLLVVLVSIHLALSQRIRLVIVLLVATLGATFLSEGMKRFFDRERPHKDYQLTEVASMSFPSGHSTLAAATYLTLALMLSATTSRRRIKIFLLGAGLFLTVLIGLSRIYLGVHFPIDVAAGWCMGAGWAFACALVARRIRRPDAVAA